MKLNPSTKGSKQTFGFKSTFNPPQNLGVQHHVQAIQKPAPGQDEGGQDGDPQVGQCDCAGGQVLQHVQDEC